MIKVSSNFAIAKVVTLNLYASFLYRICTLVHGFFDIFLLHFGCTNMTFADRRFCNDVYSTVGHTQQKRFYNRSTIRGIRTTGLAKTSTLYRDWLRFFN